ncbi:MAG: dihydropteroate synthase [Omnitrophica WOR_2 bacterium]
METILKSASHEVVIAPDQPTVIIGERINPTGKKRLAEALREGNLDLVLAEAQNQVEVGADVLDLNVGTAGVDEVALLPKVLKMVMQAVPTPVSIDSSNPAVLKAALEAHREIAPQGKPLVNSVTGEEARLNSVLPLVAEYHAAVIGLTMGDEGIPKTPEKRLEVAQKILERAASFGIPPEDILIDCLAMTVGADSGAGVVTLNAIRLVKEKLGVNMALGASNVSHGLPEREVVNQAFVVMTIMNGVNAPIVDANKMRPAVLAADLLLGRDEFASRYIKDFKKRQKRLQAAQPSA